MAEVVGDRGVDDLHEFGRAVWCSEYVAHHKVHDAMQIMRVVSGVELRVRAHGVAGLGCSATVSIGI